jgi:hypothetical protein
VYRRKQKAYVYQFHGSLLLKQDTKPYSCFDPVLEALVPKNFPSLKRNGRKSKTNPSPSILSENGVKFCIFHTELNTFRRRKCNLKRLIR